MVQFHIGCAGWSYPDWKKAHFYPKNLSSSAFLNYYAKFFNFVEINSSFYQIPTKNMILNWEESTPDDFRFSVKIWRKISHETKNFERIDKAIRNFFSNFSPIEEKISNFLLQFPPSFSNSIENNRKLKYLFTNLPKWSEFVVEFRDSSWFSEEIFALFSSNSNFSLATSYVPYNDPFYLDDQNKYYIRMIGDRKLTNFHHSQRSQKESVDHLHTHLLELRNTLSIEDIFIIFNNHFRGFAPQDVIEIKKFLGLPQRPIQKNKKILDYF